MSITSSVAQRVTAAQGLWQRSPGVRRAAVLFPVAVAVIALLLYAVALPAYFFFVMDYSVVEDLQFLFYLLGSVCAVVVARRLSRGGHRPVAVLYAVGAAALFLVAGEEVSWGQELWERIIPGFPDSEDLMSVNAQGETTLHNLPGVGKVLNAVFFLISVYGVLSAFVGGAARRAGTRSLVTFGRETLPSFAVAATFFSVYYTLLGSGVLETLRETSYETTYRAVLRYQEVAELGIAFGILLHLWLLITEDRR